MKRVTFHTCLNYVLFAAILAAGAVPLTGLRVHEWIGMTIVVLVVIHLSARWKWLIAASRGLRMSGAWRLRTNVAINAALLATTIMTIYSGLMISQSVLPAFGIRVNDSSFWDQAHKTSQLLMTFAIGFHLAINWDWIVKVVRTLRRKKWSTAVERTAFTRKMEM